MKRLFITVLIYTFIAQPVFAAGENTPKVLADSGMPFLGESFQTDLATGSATMSIPITTPPGRKNMQPKLALSYSSNSSNGICGVGWAIPQNSIQRSTKDGALNYSSLDTFLFISSGANAELADIGNNEYRAKIESAFMKYTFDGRSWLVFDKSGTKYTFGSTGASRLEKGTDIFAWYLDRVDDTHGNYVTYIYEKPGDGQVYLAEIQYTGGAGLSPDKSVVFNYSDGRPDALVSYRSSWRVATTRLLSSIHVRLGGSLVWRYELDYITSPDTGRKLLERVTVYDKNGNSLPPKRFAYQRLD